MSSLEAILNRATNPAGLRLEADLTHRLLADFAAAGGGDALALGKFLGGWMRGRLRRIAELHRIAGEFQDRLRVALDQQERDQRILGFAADLGASAKQLAGDRKALRRFFDRDAIVERYRRLVGEEERAIVFACDRIGALTATLVAEASDPPVIWRALEVDDLAGDARRYSGDPRVREAAFRCLRRALNGATGERLANEQTLLEVQRAAIDTGEPTWVQCEALTALSSLLPKSAMQAIEQRFTRPGPADDIFVRRHAVRLLAERSAEDKQWCRLAGLAAADPSAAVRQMLAQILHRFGSQTASAHCASLSRDPAPQVRAALIADCEALALACGLDDTVGLLDRALGDDDRFVLRVALDSAVRLGWSVAAEQAADIAARLDDGIAKLRSGHGHVEVRRWAAQCAEQLWCAATPAARAFADSVRTAAAGISEGGTSTVPGLADALAEPGLVGRVLSVLAQTDFDFEVVAGAARLRRGNLFAFRTWRFLHEWRNPSPDKRQAFPHWTGRVLRGRIVAPSSIMAELAPTKVPGEPLVMAEDGGWRPFLPLPDHILSAIDTGAPVELYSPEGVTVIAPPAAFLARLSARLKLSWHFSEFAALRNWTEASAIPPDCYARTVRQRLGVEMRLYPHETRGGTRAEPSSARFFSIAPVMGLPVLWEQAQLSFASLYSNTLLHLVVFLTAAFAYFLSNHVRRNRAMRGARRALSLVIGGWGTRGKSGTERLKAAMFHALGHPLVSKTTGNEAMFLHAPAFGELREMFLFRPYDKATIWEQMHLSILASKHGARVFLWECMGLAPAYIRILQRQWMRDDIATITNTYPDHEDVQGPAGRNIPEVMTEFIPQGSMLITSEEQMRPILSTAAARLGTSVDAVGWREAGLIPAEFLARFAYEEHPHNIALVVALARELGIGADFALKEMADRVVQDIGSLKVYPEAPVRTRRLEFVLGNSANERFGTLGNWARTGFDRQDPLREPGVWITTVVNNRADRVPRSRVFASILVNDIAADRHILIGSNLKGLLGYIDQAWNEMAPALTLWPADRAEPNPIAELEHLARRFRIVHRAEQPVEALRAMLAGQPDGAELAAALDDGDLDRAAERIAASELTHRDAILAHLDDVRGQLRDYQALEANIRAGGDQPTLDDRMRQELRRWFDRKIVVIEDYYATGEQIVRQIVELTPPGFRNRIMGLQNIKGTGLDFVYRWHAWETVHNACRDALSAQPARVQRGIRTLASFQEFGVLSEEYVRHALSQIDHRAGAPGEVARVQREFVSTHLDEQMAVLERDREQSAARGLRGRLMQVLEDMIDAGDSVRRRKHAEVIYRDLAAQRISADRAALELRRLTMRQKGGWLGDDLSRLHKRATGGSGAGA
jgi:poly-gamma-glutamate synthase PgsB/CapB